MKAQVLLVHLLDDLSGSPRILRDAGRALVRRGWRPRLFVGAPGTGFLSQLDVPRTTFPYRRGSNRLVTLVRYLLSQGWLFLRLLGDRAIDPSALVYVNTVLPFGAMVYGRVTGRKVLVHIHEIDITPPLLKRTLLWVVKWAASMVLYVSDAHAQALPIAGARSRRLYNSLDPALEKRAAGSTYHQRFEGQFRVLMVASLRDYKGIPEFLRLARDVSGTTEISFDLVLNDDMAAIATYFARQPPPRSVRIHPRNADTAPFYARASLVVNLSRVDQWVETFGLTILEAMAFGVPVIVPPIGGPAELVVDGTNGFLIDSRDSDALRARVLELASDEELCLRISANNVRRARDFAPEYFENGIAAALEELWNGGAK